MMYCFLKQHHHEYDKIKVLIKVYILWMGTFMLNQDKETVQKWGRHWINIGSVLEQLKREDILYADTQKCIESLDDAFESALWLCPPLATSGFIEQQRLFRRMKP